MSAPEIQSYRFDRVVIDGKTHTKDVIILPKRVIAGWWRRHGHSLLPEDLAAVLAAGPDLLVVGQGAYRRMNVTDQVRQTLEEAGIDLIAQSTKQACETYNRSRENRQVAAALHLTC